ncbi:hypothetical protein SELMODRAFT_234460 [Selaginella moellendorffii]|uniref:Zeaxanthin epoxidase, chloroplastic n=1 Tax=Selaginella moellendorffii TaxID=88036 RepID=D8SLH1_SELML|nr:zeaxanthin epoxidase, chloroplastic isoform X2 [Selaginella moellendorffii]EFJ14660.1 hypothetical protein SELMODRAFT_234460 [Selaginella moellendorffii]|eukprot:XP_002984150.1 zeaxanthin epoxidase, chloroplastic isoform X2 [Selaginella moellendorffii]
MSFVAVPRPSSVSFTGQALDCVPCHKGVSSLSIQADKSRSSLHKRLAVETNVVTRNDAGVVSASKPEEKFPVEVKEENFPQSQQQVPRLLIAGGGIGGLVLALAAKNQGLDVKVFERDLSAIRGEGQYRGPIQIQSNALAALEAVDSAVADEIMETGCITGDRVNGLVDGLTGTWYSKFDTFTPAAENGLPVTRVISRMKLQEILARAVGPELIENNANVVEFKDDGSKVTVKLEDGRYYEGDVLIGADGIRSKVREQLLGFQEPTYSGYTCYTGIADFIPPDIDTVGYRVFLGHRQYFVSSDVGYGKMQWYGFFKEPAGGTDPPGKRKERLLKLFGDWCDGVVDLLLATPEEQILRRDIYDRVPILNWSKGRVTLLGDAAHAMQPNMGQGGCMAIEDGYQLALEIIKAFKESANENKFVDFSRVLQSYESQRRLRVGAIHGMARMAAVMATTYKPYLGVGLGPLSFIKKLRIPHPGRVFGRFFVNIAMPVMLSWVLGGNSAALEGRTPSCRLTDKASDKLPEWLRNDDALERATSAEWYLVPDGEQMPFQGDITASGKKLFRLEQGLSNIIGRRMPANKEGNVFVIDSSQVADKHAEITFVNGAVFLTDFGSGKGTWITNVNGGRYKAPHHVPVRLHAGELLEFGEGKEAAFGIKQRKESMPSVARSKTPPGMALAVT